MAKAPGGFDNLAWSADALERVGQLAETRDLIDYMMEQAVMECRRSGAGKEFVDDVPYEDGSTQTRHGRTGGPISWERIGKAIGITRQTAWERYRDVDSL